MMLSSALSMLRLNMTIYKVTVPADSESRCYEPYSERYFLHEEDAQNFAFSVQPSEVYRMPNIVEIDVKE